MAVPAVSLPKVPGLERGTAGVQGRLASSARATAMLDGTVATAVASVLSRRRRQTAAAARQSTLLPSAPVLEESVSPVEGARRLQHQGISTSLPTLCPDSNARWARAASVKESSVSGSGQIFPASTQSMSSDMASASSGARSNK